MASAAWVSCGRVYHVSHAENTYLPSEWGRAFHGLPHDEALGAGAAGVGKTVVLMWEPLEQIVIEHERTHDPKHPNAIPKGSSVGWALLLRRTFPMLEQLIGKAKVAFERLDPGVHYDQQKHIFTFTSGYRYQFGHCKDPNDWQMYYGSEYTIIMFDELIQFMKEQYLQIKSRLRTSDPVLMKMLKVRAMSNPSVDRQGMEGVSLDDPLWVRKYFVDPARQGGVTLFQNITLKSGEKIRKTRIYFPGKLAQNPNKDFVRTYESNLQQLPAHIRQAQLEGDWYAVYGSFYGDEWIQDIHVCRPFQIPKDWLRFRSMDWGFKSHGCVHWWAMDFDGNLYCEKEFYFRLITATQCAERIRDMEKAAKLWDGGRSVITGPADTQLWERRGVSSLPMAAEFEAVGVPWVKADKLSRSRNAGLLMARLRDHKRRTQPPGIVFFDTCKMAIQTLPSVLCTVGDPEMPMDGGEDHAHDSVLYGCAFASRGRSGIPQRRSEFREEETDQDEGFKGGYGIQY